MRTTVRLLYPTLMLLPLLGCGSPPTTTPMAKPAGLEPKVVKIAFRPETPAAATTPNSVEPSKDPIKALMGELKGAVFSDDKADKPITGLRLSGDAVRDNALKDHVAALAKVKRLSFSGTKNMTSATIKELAKLNNLEELEFDHTKVTDEDLKELSALKGLETLELTSTGLTDSGMKELAAFKQLKLLTIKSENVSAAAEIELKKALPNCEVNVK